jgi:hypothetical protein
MSDTEPATSDRDDDAMDLDEDDMTTPTHTPLQPAGNKRMRLISQAFSHGKGNRAQKKGTSSATLGSASSAPPKPQMKGAWSTIFARDEEKYPTDKRSELRKCERKSRSTGVKPRKEAKHENEPKTSASAIIREFEEGIPLPDAGTSKRADQLLEKNGGKGTLQVPRGMLQKVEKLDGVVVEGGALLCSPKLGCGVGITKKRSGLPHRPPSLQRSPGRCGLQREAGIIRIKR